MLCPFTGGMKVVLHWLPGDICQLQVVVWNSEIFCLFESGIVDGSIDGIVDRLSPVENLATG